MRLENKTAIITGGGTGIGEAIARAYAKEGATVVLTGRRKEVLQDVVQSIAQTGGRAIAAPGSVTSEDDVRQAVDATLKATGSIDILVNNAGNLFHAGRLHDLSDQIWDDTFDIFLKGVFRFTRAVIPQMLRQNGGSILNISTVAGLKALQGLEAHPYAATKAGLVMLIRCNCICPAAVDTPGVAAFLGDPKSRAAMDAMHPLGRVGRSEEVASAAVYFASDESAWTTGSILAVDGGVTAT